MQTERDYLSSLRTLERVYIAALLEVRIYVLGCVRVCFLFFIDAQ